jgi:hypothetical protein
VVGGGNNEQHGPPLALIVEAPAPVKHAFAVLPQDPGVTVRVRDVLRMRHHPSDSSVGQVACADPSPLCAENRTPMADKCPPSIDLGSSGLLGSPSLSQKYGAIRDA